MEMYPFCLRHLSTGKHVTGFSGRFTPYKSSSFATPEGEVCSMLNIYLIRYEQHFGELAASGGHPLSGFAGLPPQAVAEQTADKQLFHKHLKA